MYVKRNYRIKVIVALCALALLLAALVLTQATTAFYVTKVTPTEDFDFSVEKPVEILTVDDFRMAINQGHPVIKVSDAADDPLYLTGEELALSASVLIDLNGHDLKRNGRDPVLSIPSGKTLVIYDSVEDPDAVGSFYNPVGSVLEINGGNITVINGKYESGVRENEYYGEAAAGSVQRYLSGAYFYLKDEDSPEESPTYSGDNTNTVPVVEIADSRSVGDLYKPAGNTFAAANAVDANNPLSGGGDYYMYYVPRSNAATIGRPRNADFFYIYKVVEGAVVSLPQATEERPYTDEMYDDCVFIYGYYKNKAMADLSSTHYGAVVMNSGSLAIMDGDFRSYYKNDTSNCVYATGGDLVINDGQFTAEGLAGCVACKITGSGSVTIKDGVFSSQRGDLIKVDQGNVNIYGGRFNKDVSATSPDSGVPVDHNAALISVASGELTVGGEETISFNIKGSYVRGIECIGAQSVATLGNFAMEFAGSDGDPGLGSYKNNTGVYNEGGSVTIGGSLMSLSSDESVGIKSVYRPGGENTVTIDPAGMGASVFVMTGERSSIVDSEGGDISIGCAQNTAPQSNTLFYLDHVYDCFGVKIGSATEEVHARTVVNLNSVQFFMGMVYYDTETDASEYYTTANRNKTTFNSCGISINSTAAGSAVNVGSAKMFCAGSYTAGIFARNGMVMQTDHTKRFALFSGATFDNYLGAGLYNSSAGSHYVTRFGKDYAVAGYEDSYYGRDKEYELSRCNAIASYGVVSFGGKVELADLYVGGYSTYGAGVYAGATVDPTDENDYILSVARFASNICIADNTNRTLFQNDPPSGFGNVYGKGAHDITSAAIKVTGGRAIVKSCDVNTDANGIVLQASGVVSALEFGQIGASEHDGTITATRAAAIRIEGGSLFIRSGDTLTVDECTISTDTSFTNEKGAALTPNAVTVTGGNFTCYGNFNINSFTGLESDNSHLINKDNAARGRYLNFGNEIIKSYAVAVTGGSFEVKPRPVEEGEALVLPNLTVKTRVGGGISVEGGSVTLGTDDVVDGKTSNIRIYTFGNDFVKDDHRYDPNASVNHDRDNLNYYYSAVYHYAIGKWGDHAWRGVQNLSGGHALQVLGGNCVIYNGDLSAALGNGVYVKNGTGSNVSVDIHGGSYYGYNGARLYDHDSARPEEGIFEGTKITEGINGSEYNEWFPYMTNKQQGGPAVYYGLKVLGNATVRIYGGEFDGGNGGAFVTGYYSDYDPVKVKFTRKTDLFANIYVYEGVFRNSMSTDGFNIADNTNLVMGAYTAEEIAEHSLSMEYLRNAIRIEAPSTCIALNSVHNNKDSDTLKDGPVDLSVYYGSYYVYNASASFIGSYHIKYTIRCAFNNSSFEEGTSKIIPASSYLVCENFISSGSESTVHKLMYPDGNDNVLGKIAAGGVDSLNIFYSAESTITEHLNLTPTYSGKEYFMDFYGVIGSASPSFYAPTPAA